MRTFRQQQGEAGEALARGYLDSAGDASAATDGRLPGGALDIGAWDGKALCVVEVRSARTPRFGPAAASVPPVKQRRLIRAAQWSLQPPRRQPDPGRLAAVG